MHAFFEKALTVVLQVALFLLPFFIPLFALTIDVGTTLTVISLLFAILVGFFIANATSNYLNLQTLIAEENADLISLFSLTKLIQSSQAEAVADAIDKYMVAQLNYNFLDHTSKTRAEFEAIAFEINKVRPQDAFGTELVSNLHDKKSHLSVTNQAISLSAKRTVTLRHWFVLILLSLLMGFLLLALRGDGFLGTALIGILFVGIYEILVLIYEIDSNRFLAKKLSYENPQDVFRAIGKLPYYPEIAITRRRISIPQGRYRVGTSDGQSDSFEKETQVVK
jgi:hypothetical protein